MSRSKESRNNKKVNKNVYNYGLYNMNSIIKYLKSYNISNYKYDNHILIYKHNHIIITIHVKEFDTTNTILQMIKLQIHKIFNNDCIIFCNNSSIDMYFINGIE